ncbi:hypothetical protein [Actinoplanes awajinensis]|uniref:Uncharacterized protein n=1 Tax=Actinoplanes awajinensis subsp. mycoplanecinus TaxID=135947 RepID=A0A124G8G3_9ACTN|nr:hypothetical protein [Actinoplanes awajinensis]KUL25856.1 hypothetical protein ADL15_39820 [Actinoplanes awajinensis subsp. mycoplanecinus]
MSTKAESDVNAAIQQYAEAMASTAGAVLENPKFQGGPCSDPTGRDSDTVYSVQGVFNLPPPASGTHLAVIDRIRTDWKANGYTITDDRTVGADNAVLAAETPDGYKLDIENASPDGFAVIINSPCYGRP